MHSKHSFLKLFLLLLLLNLFSLNINANEIIRVLKVKKNRAILLLPENFSINSNQKTLQLKDNLTVKIIKNRKNKILVLLNTNKEIKVSDQFLVKNNTNNTELELDLDLENDYEPTTYQPIPTISETQLDELEKKEQKQNDKLSEYQPGELIKTGPKKNRKPRLFISLGKNISSNIRFDLESPLERVSRSTSVTITPIRFHVGIKLLQNSWLFSYEPIQNDSGSVIKFSFERSKEFSKYINGFLSIGASMWNHETINQIDGKLGLFMGTGIEFFPIKQLSISPFVYFDVVTHKINSLVDFTMVQTAVNINVRLYL